MLAENETSMTEVFAGTVAVSCRSSTSVSVSTRSSAFAASATLSLVMTCSSLSMLTLELVLAPVTDVWSGGARTFTVVVDVYCFWIRVTAAEPATSPNKPPSSTSHQKRRMRPIERTESPPPMSLASASMRARLTGVRAESGRNPLGPPPVPGSEDICRESVRNGRAQ